MFFLTKGKTTIIGRIISIDYNKRLFTAKQDREEKPFPYETELLSDYVKGKVIGKSPRWFDVLYWNFLIRFTIFYLFSCLIDLGIEKIIKGIKKSAH